MHAFCIPASSLFFVLFPIALKSSWWSTHWLVGCPLGRSWAQDQIAHGQWSVRHFVLLPGGYEATNWRKRPTSATRRMWSLKAPTWTFMPICNWQGDCHHTAILSYDIDIFVLQVATTILRSYSEFCFHWHWSRQNKSSLYSLCPSIHLLTSHARLKYEGSIVEKEKSLHATSRSNNPNFNWPDVKTSKPPATLSFCTTRFTMLATSISLPLHRIELNLYWFLRPVGLKHSRKPHLKLTGHNENRSNCNAEYCSETVWKAFVKLNGTCWLAAHQSVWKRQLPERLGVLDKTFLAN